MSSPLLFLNNIIKAKPKSTPHNSNHFISFSSLFFPAFPRKKTMNKYELVFIPAIGAGHLASAVEMANVLVTRDPRLCVTMLIHLLPSDHKSTQQIQSLSANFAHKPISFVVLPQQPPPQHTNPNFLLTLLDITESYKPSVTEAVTILKRTVIGFVVDFFCTTMIDVANQFQVPCYFYCTFSAGSLSVFLSLQEIYDESNGSYELLKQSELALPGFVNPLPSNVIPSIFYDDVTGGFFYNTIKRIRSDFKGVLINSFVEMEPHVFNSFTSNSVSKFPSLFSIGPIVHLKNSAGIGDDGAEILNWLDQQPRCSVVFLCFGSMGSFGKEQLWEIARGLERSGVRFVWSLRKQQPPEDGYKPVDYDDIGEALPNGFLDRTAGRGKVIGWAPQVEILRHSAVGGFVSHCGWNSTLESVWHGVPMITWPMYAEQQINAFEMAVELGLAVEMVMVYDFKKPRLVKAEEIESGIRRLMEDDGEIRKKVEAKSKESQASVMEGGSSYNSLGRFIDELLANTQT